MAGDCLLFHLYTMSVYDNMVRVHVQVRTWVKVNKAMNFLSKWCDET